MPPAIISSPSRVGKTWYGATIGNTVPCRGDGAVGEVPGEVIADVRQRRLVQGHVDDRAFTRPLALEQRREDADGGPGAGADVDQARADADAGSARLAGHRDQPAGGLHERVVAGLAASGPTWPYAPTEQ